VPISEHLFGMLLMLSRKLTSARSSQMRGCWEAPNSSEIMTLAGKRLCILGLGMIGRRCAKLGDAFGMEVVGFRRNPRPNPHVRHVFGPDQLDAALRGAEVVMNILPGTEQTHNLLGTAEFQAMADRAIFLNAGRGRTVDTDAMIAALRCGKLRGAGLDVTDPEPLPEDHPLWQMPNVLVSAHYGGLHPAYGENARGVFMENLRRFIAGRPLEHVLTD
jgi:phosphoglycerate dehydrogenase-like enzyme